MNLCTWSTVQESRTNPGSRRLFGLAEAKTGGLAGRFQSDSSRSCGRFWDKIYFSFRPIAALHEVQ